MKKRNTIAIEINERSIKWIKAFARKTGLTIEKNVIREIKDEKNETIVNILKELKTEQITKSDHLVAILPRRLLTIRHLNLPTHHEEEIRKMIDLQIIHKIPYARNDVVLDYKLIGKDSSGYSRVLVVIVHNCSNLQIIRPSSP